MADAPVQVKRTLEIEEATNRYFVHPISRALVTVFARLRIRPNTVSLFGMAFGIAAGVAYYGYHHGPMALLGFALMIGWHVMDGADGQLARLTGQTSEIGKVLDGLCDYTAYISVYLGLGVALTPEMGVDVWLLLFPAGFSHAFQSSAYEFQRQAYDYWVRGKTSARIVPLDTFRRDLQGKTGLARLFGQLNLVYIKVQYRFAALDPRLHARLAETLDEAGAEASAVRALYRSVNLSSVRWWSVLSANNRTLLLFLSCLAGYPLFFVLFELVVLNVALAVLIRMQARRNEALRVQLAQYSDARDREKISA